MDSPRINEMMRVNNLLKAYVVVSLVTMGVLAYLNREQLDMSAIFCELSSLGVMYLFVTKLLKNHETVAKVLLCVLTVGKVAWTVREVMSGSDKKPVKKVKQ